MPLVPDSTRKASIAAALKNLPEGFGAAALALEVDPDASYPEDCNAQVFPDGKFRADDSRPASITNGQCLDWLMSAAVADKLIAQCAAKPILYDYDHKSIWGDTRASGWITALVYVAGRGLFAKVEWTPKAAEQIAQKEWRYSSPYFLFEVATGEITQLISVALTNDPALGDLGGVGLSKSHEGDDMPTPEETQQQVAALSTQVADLSKQLETANTELAALRKEKADAALAQEKQEHETLLEAALNDGLIVPAQKEFCEGLGLADLKKFLKTTEPFAILSKQTAGKEGGHGLSQEELDMCSKLGVKPEDFAKTKAEQKR